MSVSANPVVHLELHTGDLQAAREYYSGLCGWRPERIDAGGRSYLALELGGGFGGGIVECGTRRPLWLPYVEVADVTRVTDLRAARAPRGSGGLAQRRRRARGRGDRLLAAQALAPVALLLGDSLPGAAQLFGEVLELGESILHRQHCRLVVDVHPGCKRKFRDRRRVNVD